MDNKQPLVSICCITYNHKDYIREAIEGFLMQKTTFPIEIIIHDDASTDGTAIIVEEYAEKYPDIFVSILQKENQWSKGGGSINARFVFPRARGKYIALCEGDDYWTDPLKLQKQVDFLEANEDYGAVFTDADILYQISGKKILSYDKKHRRRIPEGDVFNELLYSSPYKSCTVLFRHKFIYGMMDYEFLKNEKFIMGDKLLWLHIAANSKIGYIFDSTSVYRVLEESASNFGNLSEYISFYKSSARLSSCFAEHYGIPINEKRLESQLKYTIATKSINSGNYKMALENTNNLRQFFMLFVKEKIVRKILNCF